MERYQTFTVHYKHMTQKRVPFYDVCYQLGYLSKLMSYFHLVDFKNFFVMIFFQSFFTKVFLSFCDLVSKSELHYQSCDFEQPVFVTEEKAEASFKT